MKIYTQTNKIDLKRVAFFLIIAISLSNVFRFDIFDIYQPLANYSKFTYLIAPHILEGSGIFIGAILAIYLLKKNEKRQCHFLELPKAKLP